ncbi:hypothetical protein LIER_04232 [Lithospermum erythrorhizon]|uniref:Nitrate regulatory gene2 protein-like n=1 Tax=Lithospermum erythrorhizon TaxID=34254 RepID=A0AAV3NXD1_LITER
MGCVASRLEAEEDVVSICKERKQQLKLAVERRYALADTHYRYCQALYGVSAALKLFVARHSSPSSAYPAITLTPSSPPKDNNVLSNPLYLHQMPSQPIKESIGPCDIFPDSSDEETEAKKQAEQNTGYYYMEVPPAMPSPQTDFGWDFFNPFNGYHRITEDDLRRVREQEGIPELEAEEEEAVDEENDENGNAAEEQPQMAAAQGKGNANPDESRLEIGNYLDVANATQGEQKRLSVIGTPESGRELLEALQDIEDYFMRAYDSGKQLTRMLEANRVHFQSNLEEVKENSTKLIQAITWKSPSSRSSSCKSLVASSSKSSSTWTEFSNDLFDDYGGMASGSHSLTLGRLYAWEKKLYEEVKSGDNTQKLYEKKCNQLQSQDVRGDGHTVDKTRSSVKDLYSRILVAIRSAETISERIEKLRDEELQPQIFELLQGLMRTWAVMLGFHEIQNKVISEVKTFNCPSYGKFCNDSHRLATLQLEAELHNWRTCFTEYIAAQKAYVKALHGWLSRFVVPEVEYNSHGGNRGPTPLCQANGPPLLMICLVWLSSLEKLPDKSVAVAIKNCAKDVRSLWIQQGEEQQQKRKVDSLSKELDRKIFAFRKAETKTFEFKLTDQSSEQEIDHRVEFLKERTDLLDNFRKKVDTEKERHQSCVEETQRTMLGGFQTGFGRIFESMIEFCIAASKGYDDLLNMTLNVEKHGSQSFISGSEEGECKK